MYSHTDLVAEEQKSPTQEHHPDTNLPKSPHWSLLRIWQNTTIQIRRRKQSHNMCKLTRSNQTDKQSHLSAGFSEVPGHASSTSWAPLHGVISEPRGCTRLLPQIVWIKWNQLHLLGWMSYITDSIFFSKSTELHGLPHANESRMRFKTFCRSHSGCQRCLGRQFPVEFVVAWNPLSGHL